MPPDMAKSDSLASKQKQTRPDILSLIFFIYLKLLHQFIEKEKFI